MNQKIKNQKKLPSAFSMIEMSLVLLVIGAIIASIIGASIAMDKYRLTLARALTESSPVTVTKNLKLWYETTSKKSFLESETDNGLAITTWYDRNTVSNSRNNATSSSTARPLYTTNCVNSLPCLRFDGSNDLLSFDGAFLAATDFTIFVVEQRRISTQNYFIAGSGGTDNNNLILGYRSDALSTFAMWNNDLDVTVPSYVPSRAKIHVFTLSSVNGKLYHLNGASVGTGASQTTQLISFPGASIGLFYSTAYYNGDICEIIMFDRAITDEERRNIEGYLSQKWKITVS